MMSIAVPSHANAAVPRPIPCKTDDPVKGAVRELMVRLFPGGLPSERRRDGRYAFPFLVRLTPVDVRTQGPLTEPIVVVGKDLSERGLGFFHPHPLPYRRAIVTLEDCQGRTVSLLIDLSWCRFMRLGWYESGGRFLQIVTTLAA